MKTETLLQILFANGHEDLIALAVKIDNGIETVQPKSVLIRLYKSDLPVGKKFAGRDESYGYVECTIISTDPYKVKENHLVLLPNGKTKFVTYETPSDRPTEIVDIEVAPSVAAEL